jgi:hypothetical protein
VVTCSWGASERVEGDLFWGVSFCELGGLVIGVVDEVVFVWVFPLLQAAGAWAEEGALRMNVVGTGMGRDGLEKHGDFLGVRSSSVGVFTRARKRKLLGRELNRRERASTDCSGAWFMRFVGGRSSDGPGFAKAWGCGNDVRRRCGNVGQEVAGSLQGWVEGVAGGWRRVLKRLVVIEHPARQRRFGRFLNPLVDQCRDFSS